MPALQGKTAIVTGGIGWAIATRFANEGAKVYVADLSADRCQAACRSIGPNAISHPIDIRNLDAIAAMASG